jgi:alpha-ketoglutaric semialdehyde dehydrogenase
MHHPLLIDGRWQPAQQPLATFSAFEPASRTALDGQRFPVSSWHDLDAMLDAGKRAAVAMAQLPASRIADFLQRYAAALETRAEALVEAAHRETGLPREPRLRLVELPRTTTQLRQAALAAVDATWRRPTIDSRANIRSLLEPLHGPVLVMGPNNFPFAFNGIAGGDFAAAIAAGNPVIAKAHPAHPQTSLLLAEAAAECARAALLPDAAVQMFFHTTAELGLRLVADARIAATAFTGSRAAGMALKAAADAAGRPIYLEMSSVNPVFVLSAALRERGAAIAAELNASCALGAGQFCTRPGIVVLAAGEDAAAFEAELARLTDAATPGVLLTPQAPQQLADTVAQLRAAGAGLLSGGEVAGDAAGYAFRPTLLRVSGAQFLQQPAALQRDAFGHLCLLVVAQSDAELLDVAHAMEGNLTGTIYSHTEGADDALYDRLAPILRPTVGRLLNDRMPTGVAVSPAMNHGGPYPATGHPGFTAVGIPASLLRFSALRCYDNVREHRLPPVLRDVNPDARVLRWLDGELTPRDVG